MLVTATRMTNLRGAKRRRALLPEVPPVVRRTILACLLLALAPAAAPAQEWARKMFPVASHDFGMVARGAKAEFAFELQNLYEEELHIASVRSSCGCTTPTIVTPTLKTWEKGVILATFNTRSFLGQKSATITVVFDKPYPAEVQLQVHGYIRSDVVFEPGAVDFGALSQGAEAARTVKVSYAGRSTWKIVDVRSANTNLEVELTETRRGGGRVEYDMLVRVKPTMPAGFLQSELQLVTDDPAAAAIPLAVEGQIESPLTVSPASVLLGVVAPGAQITKQLVVKGDEPFHILAVKCNGECIHVETNGEAKKLHILPLVFTASAPPGAFSDVIEIETDLGGGAVGSCTATATISEQP